MRSRWREKFFFLIFFFRLLLLPPPLRSLLLDDYAVEIGPNLLPQPPDIVDVYLALRELEVQESLALGGEEIQVVHHRRGVDVRLELPLVQLPVLVEERVHVPAEVEGLSVLQRRLKFKLNVDILEMLRAVERLQKMRVQRDVKAQIVEVHGLLRDRVIAGEIEDHRVPEIVADELVLLQNHKLELHGLTEDHA